MSLSPDDVPTVNQWWGRFPPAHRHLHLLVNTADPNGPDPRIDTAVGVLLAAIATLIGYLSTVNPKSAAGQTVASTHARLTGILRTSAGPGSAAWPHLTPATQSAVILAVVQ